jgi:hypothetical protein
MRSVVTVGYALSKSVKIVFHVGLLDVALVTRQTPVRVSSEQIYEKFWQ